MSSIRCLFTYCLLCLFCFSHKTEAQERKLEVFAFEYDFFPTAGLDQPLPGSPNLEAEISDFNIRAAYPLILSEGTVLLNKFSYQYLDFTYKNDIATPPFRPDKLHELSYQVGLRTPLGAGWSLVLSANPSLATDFENVGSKHVKLAGGLVLSRKIHHDFNLGFGARWSNDFGSGLILPVLRVDYFNGSNFYIDLFLPKYAQLWYLPTEAFHLGISAGVKGNHYRIGESAVLPNNTSTEDSRIKYSVITIGPAVRIATVTNTYLTLEGGISLVRRFEFFDANDTELQTLDLESKAFVRLGVQFRR